MTASHFSRPLRRYSALRTLELLMRLDTWLLCVGICYGAIHLIEDSDFAPASVRERTVLTGKQGIRFDVLHERTGLVGLADFLRSCLEEIGGSFKHRACVRFWLRSF